MIEREGKLAIIHTEDVERIFVLGDIHGDLDSFKRAMAKLTSRDVAVFLGDYADRGPYGLEVIEALMSVTTRYPERFIALKGNHEDFSADGEPLFYPCTLTDEVVKKGRKWSSFFSAYKPFVDNLPLSALIPGYALLAHGGISAQIETQADLERPSAQVERDILWSDPGEEPGLHRSPRGAGSVFGPDVSGIVLSALGLRHLYRSHQPRRAAAGPVADHEGRVITTSCTSVYGGRPFAVRLSTSELPTTEEDIAGSVEFFA